MQEVGNSHTYAELIDIKMVCHYFPIGHVPMLCLGHCPRLKRSHFVTVVGSYVADLSMDSSHLNAQSTNIPASGVLRFRLLNL